MIQDPINLGTLTAKPAEDASTDPEIPWYSADIEADGDELNGYVGSVFAPDATTAEQLAQLFALMPGLLKGAAMLVEDKRVRQGAYLHADQNALGYLEAAMEQYRELMGREGRLPPLAPPTATRSSRPRRRPTAQR